MLYEYLPITDIFAREILDSRGNPTVETEVTLAGEYVARASVPSGASTGQFEAHEKRDGNSARYRGKGVLEAASVVKEEISPALKGLNASDQALVDQTLRLLDGSEDKGHYGANVLLAISLAVALYVIAVLLFGVVGREELAKLPFVGKAFAKKGKAKC